MMEVWLEKKKPPRPREVEQLKRNRETSSRPLYICVYTYVGGILRKKTEKTNIIIKRRKILSSTQEQLLKLTWQPCQHGP
jgi:hypothetical protein